MNGPPLLQNFCRALVPAHSGNYGEEPAPAFNARFRGRIGAATEA